MIRILLLMIIFQLPNKYKMIINCQIVCYLNSYSNIHLMMIISCHFYRQYGMISIAMGITLLYSNLIEEEIHR